MELEHIYRRLAALPEEAQQAVAAFIARLEAGQASAVERPSRSLADEPFIGMWADRDDMADSTAYVRRLRKREWSE